MSRAELERFTTDVQSDPVLETELSQMRNDPQALVQWALKLGYGLSMQEAQGLASSYEELSDEELENVAGGWDGTSGGSG